MATPSGRPTDTASLQASLERDRRDIEQIKRELVNIPRAQAASGLGGWAWAYADNSTVVTNPGSAWGEDWVLNSGTGTDPVVLRSNVGTWVENRIGVDRAGLYTITAQMIVTFGASRPTTVVGHLRGVAHLAGGAGSDIHARQLAVPVDSAGVAVVSLSIAGMVDPSLYDGIHAHLNWTGTHAPIEGPFFRLDIVRHA